MFTIKRDRGYGITIWEATISAGIAITSQTRATIEFLVPRIEMRFPRYFLSLDEKKQTDFYELDV